jgi:REP element-mobilizing transposase RayT
MQASGWVSRYEPDAQASGWPIPEYEPDAQASGSAPEYESGSRSAPKPDLRCNARMEVEASRMSRNTFNVGEPLAYFLTWTTYGTWLPGDDRGWNRRGDPEIRRANPLFVEMARSLLKEPVFRLSAGDRRIVEATIRDHCRVRNWHLHAVNVRSNHVHVIVTAGGYPPDAVRDQFKAWCTRRLREAGATRGRFWTEGASCRWINDEDALEAAVHYVIEAQDRKGVADDE